ncbi:MULTISPECIES: hypothetical protein [Legionella]|uniref:Uncharacterized protein n=1 Tax=Legionella drozanskii LLAP-1 TaxID=1212489 RepID=A0A0W0TEC9_9GAMM|nr:MULTISPECIES: hypothetical protein [Legionella]KTC93821.1 hypothetical protein Ldro_0171 [Legionella drozanskii LLAP-1]PJE13783.1 MAG: hypothetical protein CK430_05850 [Legionella sp.]
MRKGEIFATGLTLNFFDSPDFEKENGDSREDSVIIARNALRILMMGWHDNWKDLASKRVLKAIFVKRDHELTRGMRLAFQQGFDSIFDQLQDSDLNEQQLNQAQLFISNCLSLLPFSDPNPYESFIIPQLIEGQWRKVEYKITPIELTPTKGFSKLLIDEYDRVFAYGLTPLIDTEAEPHLIFMGTTYPAGQGFSTQVDTDLALGTPGSFLYEHGRKKIIEWVTQQYRLGKKTHVCGTSLGGSLSLLSDTEIGNMFSRVDAVNSPGEYEPWLYKFPYDHWDEFVQREEDPPTYVQKQGNDLVSRHGKWKKEWHILQVNPPESIRGPNVLTDHALMYTGFAETEVVVVDTEEDNEERRSRDFWSYTLLRGLSYYFGYLPYRVAILPMLRFVLNNKLATALTLLFVLASIFLLPALSTAVATVLFTAALIPLTIFYALKVYESIKIVLGWNEVTQPACHSPNLPRNEELDLYANEVSTSFTYKEIREYYEAKRCTLKGKEFLPEENEKNQEKREMLSYSSDPSHDDERVDFRASKAKIFSMKQTIQLLGRFGLQASANPSLKTALQEEYDAYKVGKPEKSSLSFV